MDDIDEGVVQHRITRLRTWVKQRRARLSREVTADEMWERINYNWPTASDEERERVFQGAQYDKAQ